MVKRQKVLLLFTFAFLFLLAWYQYTKSKQWWSFPLYSDGTPAGEVGDKVIVIAKLASEDTSWVAENLPDWQHSIYTVDDPSSPLHTPTNKGKESLTYLTYITTHYASLPHTLVFLHPHKSGYLRGWHTDAWNWDNARVVRSLRLDYVQESGYVNLRCNWRPGCLKEHYRPNEHVTEEVWGEVFGNGSEGMFPGQVGQACCAQFAVSREQVLKRSLEEYEGLRRWVLDTELRDEKSGRVMEFLWHVVFGKEAVFCPEPSTCYCEVYGRCD